MYSTFTKRVARGQQQQPENQYRQKPMQEDPQIPDYIIWLFGGLGAGLVIFLLSEMSSKRRDRAKSWNAAIAPFRAELIGIKRRPAVKSPVLIGHDFEAMLSYTGWLKRRGIRADLKKYDEAHCAFNRAHSNKGTGGAEAKENLIAAIDRLLDKRFKPK